MIDLATQINDVARRVADRTLEAGEARDVILRQTYRSGIVDVWDACTTPERLARWFLPVTGDLTEGGRYQLEGNAGGTISSCCPRASYRPAGSSTAGLAGSSSPSTPSTTTPPTSS